jgi:hypothetical protein
MPGSRLLISRRRLTVTLRKFLVSLAIVIIVILAVVIWVIPSDEDFRVENTFWNGSSRLGTSQAVTPLETLADLPEMTEGTTLILIPYLPLTSSELDDVTRFVSGGGTLVLADDYGYGNEVLSNLGIEARFSGQALLDPLFNYKNEQLPRIFNFSSDSVTSGVGSLVLNHATCLTDVEGSEVLAMSSSFSFLDVNDNRQWDEGEPTGAMPVISSHSLAGGRVILVSDPSIFINSMDTLDDDYSVIENIAGISSSGLYLDQSHLPHSDLHYTKNLLADIRSVLTTPVGTLALVAVLLIMIMRPMWPRKGGGIGDQE